MGKNDKGMFQIEQLTFRGLPLPPTGETTYYGWLMMIGLSWPDMRCKVVPHKMTTETARGETMMIIGECQQKISTKNQQMHQTCRFYPHPR